MSLKLSWALPGAGRNTSLIQILQPSTRNKATANSRRMQWFWKFKTAKRVGLAECKSVTNSHGCCCCCCCFSSKFKLPNSKSLQMELCALMQPLKRKSATGFSLGTSKKELQERSPYQYQNPSSQIVEGNRKCLNLGTTHKLFLVQEPGLRKFVGNG